jgi:hypothetical protein
MKVYTLFELFLTAFAFYAILEFEGDMRIIIPSLCLLTSCLFGRLRRGLKEKEGREQRLKYII